jgi:hypothetical protein
LHGGWYDAGECMDRDGTAEEKTSMKDGTVYVDGWGRDGKGCGHWENERYTCRYCTCRYWHRWGPTRNCVLRVVREHSLKEVAQSMSMTRQRVHQIEKKAMMKVMAVFGHLGWEVRDGVPVYSPYITHPRRRSRLNGG